MEDSDDLELLGDNVSDVQGSVAKKSIKVNFRTVSKQSPIKKRDEMNVGTFTNFAPLDMDRKEYDITEKSKDMKFSEDTCEASSSIALKQGIFESPLPPVPGTEEISLLELNETKQTDNNLEDDDIEVIDPKESAHKESLSSESANVNYGKDEVSGHLDLPKYQMESTEHFDKNLSKNLVSETKEKENKTLLFMDNLPKDIEYNEFLSLFENLASVRNCKIIRNKKNNLDCAYGYIEYYSKSDSEKAIQHLNGCKIGSNEIAVGYADQARTHEYSKIGPTNLFVTRLPKDITKERLHEVFGQYGTIVNLILPKYLKLHIPAGIAYIRYENGEDAKEAIKELNNSTMFDSSRPLSVKPTAKRDLRPQNLMSHVKSIYDLITQFCGGHHTSVLSKTAIVGLEYIEEYYDEFTSRCNLCNLNLSQPNRLVNHIISKLHQRRYLTTNFPDLVKRMDHFNIRFDTDVELMVQVIVNKYGKMRQFKKGHFMHLRDPKEEAEIFDQYLNRKYEINRGTKIEVVCSANSGEAPASGENFLNFATHPSTANQARLYEIGTHASTSHENWNSKIDEFLNKINRDRSPSGRFQHEDYVRSSSINYKILKPLREVKHRSPSSERESRRRHRHRRSSKRRTSSEESDFSNRRTSSEESDSSNRRTSSEESYSSNEHKERPLKRRRVISDQDATVSSTQGNEPKALRMKETLEKDATYVSRYREYLSDLEVVQQCHIKEWEGYIEKPDSHPEYDELCNSFIQEKIEQLHSKQEDPALYINEINKQCLAHVRDTLRKLNVKTYYDKRRSLQGRLGFSRTPSPPL